MWDLIRKDPILKTIFIFIIGIFAFSFAFSIMFGTGQPGMSGMEDSMSSGGYNAATGLGVIIVLLSKVLIIVLLIAIIIAAVKFLKKHVIANEPIKGMEHFKNKPILAILIGVGGILLLLLSINMISPSNIGNEMINSTSTSTLHQNSFGMGVAGLLSPILRLFTIVSFIGLIIGLVMYFKGRYFHNVKGSSLVKNRVCADCGNELQSNWKCCPSCGTVKNESEEVEFKSEANGIN